MRKLRRLFLQLLAALLLAGLLAYSFWPRPIEVDIATATCGPLRVTVDEDGKTRIKERYIVSAPLAGRLQRIVLRAGAEVKFADSLAVIEPGDPALLDERALRRGRGACQGRRGDAQTGGSQAGTRCAWPTTSPSGIYRRPPDGDGSRHQFAGSRVGRAQGADGAGGSEGGAVRHANRRLPVGFWPAPL